MGNIKNLIGSQCHIDLIERTLRTLICPDTVVELRVPKYQKSLSYHPTVSGYYDTNHLDAMAAAASEMSGSAPGIYYTINPVVSGQLAVSGNDFIVGAPKGGLTADVHIVRRHCLPIDIDPARMDGSIKLSSNMSTTKAEKAIGLETARSIELHLTMAGWPIPIIVDSGNGYYVLYKIDLPSQDNGLVENCIRALAKLFNTPSVSIDERCHNPARIMKIPYTKACKGTSTRDRPHRYSKIVDCPPAWDIVPLQLLRELAESYTGSGTIPSSTGDGSGDGSSRASRARAYIMKMNPSKDGANGHDQLYKVAMVLMNDFALPEDQALELFREYNARPDCDPESEEQLSHKLASAVSRIKSQGGPTGWKARQPQFNGQANAIADHGPGEAASDPHRLARTVIDASVHADGPTIVYWRGEWHKWVLGRYRCTSHDEMRAMTTAAIKDEFDRIYLDEVAKWSRGEPPEVKGVNIGLVNNVLQALASMTLLDGDIESPAWLGGSSPFPPSEVLPTHTNIVHLPSHIEGIPATIPSTPRFFVPYRVGYDFDPSSASPTHWLEFLDSLWPDDCESKACLQSWFGYCLTPDTSQHKILMLIGPTRCGKGTIGRVLGHLIGVENVPGPTLAGLGTNLGLAPLIGKPCAVIGDAKISGKSDQAQIIERLLSISGEDTITLDRKNREAWTGRLPTRLTLLTTEMPRFIEASCALVGRLLPLVLTETWLGREDTGLEAKFVAELPGILLWAIEGYRALRAAGKFILPASSSEVVGELSDLASPMKSFVLDMCELGSNHRVNTNKLFDAWREWCVSEGRDYPGDRAGFGRQLRAVVPKLKRTQTRVENKPVRFYEGIKLR